MKPKTLRVVILKPSKYAVTGVVERFRRGFMPNATVPYISSMTPPTFESVKIEVCAVDEYVQTDLRYLDLLRRPDKPTLLALVGVQSHQFHRALDLAALALDNGVKHAVIGGPHAMTCDTSTLHNRGVSFAVAEAELIWSSILHDAIRGELQPVYGETQRWQVELEAPVLVPPSSDDLHRYLIKMAGVYPARGCPFTCNFCSVIKIAGRQIRSQSIDTTMASLRALKKAGVRFVMFTSDNFNKYQGATELLECMIRDKLELPFFVQCDTQIAKDEQFVDLLGRAGCFQMFVGVESFRRKVLLAAHKAQNHPNTFREIVRLCRKNRITTHFSNIIGFPGDTAKDIRNHVEILREHDPDVASFYILTPIPGTDQYADFLAAGKISESNLDRFDATCSVWDHDVMSKTELENQLFDCYRRFYSSGRTAKSIWRNCHNQRLYPDLIPGLGVAVFGRFCAWKHLHPMSGGIGRVKRDAADRYIAARIHRYGFDYAPLPQNLNLSASDAALNSRVRIAL